MICSVLYVCIYLDIVNSAGRDKQAIVINEDWQMKYNTKTTKTIIYTLAHPLLHMKLCGPTDIDMTTHSNHLKSWRRSWIVILNIISDLYRCCHSESAGAGLTAEIYAKYKGERDYCIICIYYIYLRRR